MLDNDLAIAVVGGILSVALIYLIVLNVRANQANRNYHNQIQNMLDLSPRQFEVFCKRFLEDYGYENVRVTGGSNDGGIDGEATLKNDITNSKIYFQCKKYRGYVGTAIVRDFRGALDGRSQSGLLITTGKFSQEAIKEAKRPGAIKINLISGRDLVDKIKNLNLNVRSIAVDMDKPIGPSTVKIGLDEADSKLIFASYDRELGPYLHKNVFLPRHTDIEKISLDRAVRLFQMPILLGQSRDGRDVWVKNGRHGHYLQVGNLTASLQEETDPLTVDLEAALKILKYKKEKRQTQPEGSYPKQHVRRSPGHTHRPPRHFNKHTNYHNRS